MNIHVVLRGHRWLATVYVLLCVLLLAAVAVFVDLAPHVDRDFFFSSEDAAVSIDGKISELFPGGSQVVISVVGDLDSSRYYAGVGRLTHDLERVPGVDRVQSITEGPKSPRHAFRSPFWKRLIGGEDGKSTLVLVWLEDSARGETISGIEQVVEGHRPGPLEFHLSGVPYVVEQIRRHLVRDMIVFSSAAVLVFGLILLLLFRSLTILLGAMVCCLSACCATLIATHLLEMRIGVLTANLVTIVFIMTLHHVIYLTFAWRRAAAAQATGRAGAVEGAVREMLVPSWWVMVTTLMGFGSLVFVDAQPLRELGIAGALGAVIAFLTAYLCYPSFLHLPAPPLGRAEGRAEPEPEPDRGRRSSPGVTAGRSRCSLRWPRSWPRASAV